jgi:hypothetical protein
MPLLDRIAALVSDGLPAQHSAPPQPIPQLTAPVQGTPPIVSITGNLNLNGGQSVPQPVQNDQQIPSSSSVRPAAQRQVVRQPRTRLRYYRRSIWDKTLCVGMNYFPNLNSITRGPGPNFRPNQNLQHRPDPLDFWGLINHDGSFSLERN